MMLRRALLAGVGAVIAAPAVLRAQPVIVRLPRLSERQADPRDGLPRELLRLALQRAGVPAEIRIGTYMTQARAVETLRSERSSIDVVYFGTSAELERALRPVRVPLTRGLLGWRLAIIHADRQAEFAAIRTLDDLRQFSIGQGIGWADVGILNANGLRVFTAGYDGLFTMLNSRRFDLFLRGAHEAFAEVDALRSALPALAVERTMTVVYPFDWFFFTGPADGWLGEAIERGLLAMVEDGSFERTMLDDPFIARTLRDARLGERARIDLENPSLSAETRALPERFWMRVS